MKQAVNRSGMALPLVVIIMGIMLILGFSTLSLISNQAKFNVVNEDTNKALEYAEAGYNQYLWHLNDELNFYSTDAHDELVNKPIEFEDGFFMVEANKPSDTDRFVTIKSTGWSKDDQTIKKTILAKIRKKQFVHHVYVSDDDGDIWWTTGDESHGAYHTNATLNIQQKPVFYDTVSYSKNLKKGTGYNPTFKVTSPNQPQKVDPLGFPSSNSDLKSWAEKDGMVFEGRTCIYLDGDTVKIRNQNEDTIKEYKISEKIPNLVIYVDKVPDTNKTIKGGTDKFGIRSGNVFVSGELEGRLTIGAEETIYITHSDPTNWYDDGLVDVNDPREPNQPPASPPGSGGITYKNTAFSGKKTGGDSTLSSFDNEKGIWARYASGKDMLGLIANQDILILHYGWPKKASNSNRRDDSWNSRWVWKGYWSGWNYKYKWQLESYNYDVAPHNVTIHAALFSVFSGYGFGYESYGSGPRKGDITLWGNITQRTRKAVGTVGSTGYNKKYAHDPRMFYDYPPHILEPTNVGWEIHEWKEIKDHVEEKP